MGVIQQIPGVPANDDTRREVVVLRVEDKFANAADLLLKEQTGRLRVVRSQFLAAMTTWLQGLDQKKKAHGWKGSDFGGRYKDCWVFKYDQHRVYGFLNRLSRRAMQCVLVHYYGNKKQNKTNTTVLDKVLTLAADGRVAQGLEKFEKEGANK